MGRPKGSKNKTSKKTQEEEIVKVKKSKIEVVPPPVPEEIIEPVETVQQPEVKPQVEVICDYCSHPESTHYGSKDRWCNVNKCLCGQWIPKR